MGPQWGQQVSGSRWGSLVHSPAGGLWGQRPHCPSWLSAWAWGKAVATRQPWPESIHFVPAEQLTWTGKSGLKVFKCLGPQRQKGSLNKWCGLPWHTSQLWEYKRPLSLSWTGAEKWHNTEGIGHRGIWVTLEMTQILLLILSTWDNV